MKTRGFHIRSLTAFLMATGFLVATVTGIVLYVTPKGNIANWTGWTLAGLDKDAWGDVHLVTGFMFIVAGLVHLYFNWKPLKNYLVSRASRSVSRKTELLAALAVTAFIIVGSIEPIPPITYVLEFNDWAKTELWVSGARDRSDGTGASRHDQALKRASEAIDAALADTLGKGEPLDRQSQKIETDDHANQHVGGRGDGGQGGGFGRLTVQ
ncbi:MAG: DUF4405 domain-containing protein, partial [Rhodospirillales bacterium]|nr:DUF4405 domain-containing protein [Rhodospirillales bacterium]